MGFIILIATLIFCLCVGAIIEKNTIKKLEIEEKRLSNILIFNEKKSADSLAGCKFHLAKGSVVISSDYFKATIASIKSIFGGNIRSYERIMDLGRRLSIVRMKQDAESIGATMIFNVRIDTAMLNQATGKQGILSAEFFAYGTAWVPNS